MSRFKNIVAKSWNVNPPVPCPQNCEECPVFKSFDVYNQKFFGRSNRVRRYLAQSAIGYSEVSTRGSATFLLHALTQQAFALMQNDAIVNQDCPGPSVEYAEDLGTQEYECLGVIHISSRAERLGMEKPQ